MKLLIVLLLILFNDWVHVVSNSVEGYLPKATSNIVENISMDGSCARALASLDNFDSITTRACRKSCVDLNKQGCATHQECCGASKGIIKCKKRRFENEVKACIRVRAK